MRRLQIVWLGSAVALALTVGAVPRALSQVVSSKYISQDTVIIKNKEAVSIVFIGDSITELWGHFDGELFKEGVINRGIGKETSAQVLSRFEQDALTMHPKQVHILVGTNDVLKGSPPEVVISNVKVMVQKAQAQGVHVVIAGVLPIGWIHWQDLKTPPAQPLPPERVAVLDRMLKALAKSSGSQFIDYSSAVSDGAGSQRPDLSIDGVHPNAAGYAAMSLIANKHLNLHR